MKHERFGLKTERRFAAVMMMRGVALFRNHRVFRFGLSSYRPDFLDPATRTYYEVIGSRQRYHQLWPKLDLMANMFPDVTLRVVRSDGEPWTQQKKRRWVIEAGQEIEQAIFERNLRVLDVAALAGVHPSNLDQALSGYWKGPRATELIRRVRTWTQLGVMPAAKPTRSAIEATRRAERLARSNELLTRIRSTGIVCSAIARGFGISPQSVNDALHGGSPGVARRIVAWLDGPGANGAGQVDLRRKEYKA